MRRTHVVTIAVCAAVGAALAVTWHVSYAQETPLALMEREIEVRPTSQIQEPLHERWTFAEKLKEADALLENIELYVGTKNITYYEDRFSYANGKISKTRKKISDPEREIALVLLNSVTGELKRITVVKRGGELITPPEWPLTIVPRTSGIVWNYWNTMYKAPEPYIVLKNRWPQESGKGKKRTIEYITYAPYSSDLHRPELVELGRTYVQNIITQATATLRTRGVHSRAFPGSLIADVAVLKSEYFERLPIIEQTDLGEFILDPRSTAERVLVLFGANGDKAFAYTGSKAGAQGAFQYTRGTWDTMRKQYPTAQLPKFDEGVTNHVASAMAAILLHDNNLKRLMSTFGEHIATDARLEEYLAAAYNGNPTHVVNSLLATLTKQLENWGIRLKTETKGYLVKIRELRKLDLFNEATEQSAGLPVS